MTGLRTRAGGVRPVAALCLAAILLGLIGSGVGTVLGSHTTAGELSLMRRLEPRPHAALTAVAQALSVLGSESVLVPVAAVVAIMALRRRAVRVAAFVAVATIGGIVLPDAVKSEVGRPRPALVHLVHVASSSFPSGHAAQTAAILPALALAAAHFGARRTVAVGAAVAGSVAVGLSRIVLGVHYPTDVLAGWVLGGAWCAVSYAVLLGRRYTVRA